MSHEEMLTKGAMTTLFALFRAGAVRAALILPALVLCLTAEGGFDSVTAGRVAGTEGMISYEARVETIALKDEKDRPLAEFVAFSYTASGSDVAAERPVVFLFNGGPIVPSVYLHMGLFGPSRVKLEGSPGSGSSQGWSLESNPDTLLDAADLVYIDPPTTGFSRLADGRRPEDFLGIKEDARLVADFILKWLERHDRRKSPVYLFGESYGTIRAPHVGQMITRADPPARLGGMMLLGQAVNIVEYSQRPDNILSYVVSLPSLALIARHHGLSEFSGLKPDELYRKAAEFAEREYLPALYRGGQIAQDRLERMAKKLAAFTGIPASWYVEHRLRISKQEFSRRLIQDPPALLGQYDGRYSGPLDDDNPVDPAASIAEAYQQAFETYRNDVLGVDAGANYVLRAGISHLDDWDWLGSSPFGHFNYARVIDELFEDIAEFRLYIGSGYYDLTTTSGSADHLVRQSSWPADRVMLKHYPSGHMAYSDEESARRIARDVRAFMAGQQR